MGPESIMTARPIRELSTRYSFVLYPAQYWVDLCTIRELSTGYGFVLFELRTGEPFVLHASSAPGIPLYYTLAQNRASWPCTICQDWMSARTLVNASTGHPLIR
eukprot:2534851-Rhodomonas_salina.2